MPKSKVNTGQFSLITTAAEPIPGSHLYRRWQAGREISPIYLAEAANEQPAIDEATAAGQRSVTFGDATFIELGGQWYCWSFPWKPEREQG